MKSQVPWPMKELPVFAIIGDSYHRTIAESALVGALFVAAGLFGLAVFFLFFRRARLFFRVVILLLSGAFLFLGGMLTPAATADLFSAPAHIQGTVTAHQITADKNPSQHGAGSSYTYEITLSGQNWSVGSDTYNHFGIGRCVVLTYGPHSHVVTDAQACPHR